jgi:hypothetical protein
MHASTRVATVARVARILQKTTSVYRKASKCFLSHNTGYMHSETEISTCEHKKVTSMWYQNDNFGGGVLLVLF